MLSATRQEGRRHYTVPKGWQWASAWFILWLNQAIPIKISKQNYSGLCSKNASSELCSVIWQDNIIINILETINGWHPFWKTKQKIINEKPVKIVIKIHSPFFHLNFTIFEPNNMSKVFIYFIYIFFRSPPTFQTAFKSAQAGNNNNTQK